MVYLEICRIMELFCGIIEMKISGGVGVSRCARGIVDMRGVTHSVEIEGGIQEWTRFRLMIPWRMFLVIKSCSGSFHNAAYCPAELTYCDRSVW